MLQDCGLNKNLLNRMKFGFMPSADKLVIIALYIGVSTDYLLTGKNNLADEAVEETMSIEEFAEMQGVTDDEDIKSLKHLFELMKKKNCNMELSKEFISKEFKAN